MDAVKCSLCGYSFDRRDTSCAGCPMAKGGHLMCCPKCGYQQVGSSMLLEFLNNLWNDIKQYFTKSTDRRDSQEGMKKWKNG